MSPSWVSGKRSELSSGDFSEELSKKFSEHHIPPQRLNIYFTNSLNFENVKLKRLY